MEQPDQDRNLENVVEGNESEDEPGELVNDIEKAEDHPVSEPLLVVRSVMSLEGVEAHKYWIGNTEEVGDEG